MAHSNSITLAERIQCVLFHEISNFVFIRSVDIYTDVLDFTGGLTGAEMLDWRLPQVIDSCACAMHQSTMPT